MLTTSLASPSARAEGEEEKMNQSPKGDHSVLINVLIGFVLLVGGVCLFGIRRGSKRRPSCPDPFPAGLYICHRYPYFLQAHADPEHAQTACPECGLTLLSEEKTS